jgi:D-alanyl-D-alanine carboxypeptidase (penicillin-binding protein 5/6)
MWIPARLSATLAAGALAVVTLTATGATASAAPRDVVGGSELAAKGVVVAPGAPGLPDVAAASWLVADLDTGQVLAAKDPHGQYAPASTIKMLTALALIPELPAGRTVMATYDDVAVDGSRVGIVEQVDYPVSELFSALLMVSGNDAANVLASAAGGQEHTAELMDETAEALGALDTHAVNPHGLDAQGQVSSAYDLALIARAGLDDPDFARYVSTVSSSISAPGGARIAIRNKNKLLGRYEGALGVKNGYTNAARASFVGAAERDGRRLVVTLMRADPQVFDEAVKLLDWGFAAQAATPVGLLVAPEQDRGVLAGQGKGSRPTDVAGASRTAASGSALSGTSTSAAAAPRAAPKDEVGLPVTLAGFGLAAAALLAVRARPEPARAGARRPRQRRSPSRAPGQRRAAESRAAELRAPRPSQRSSTSRRGGRPDERRR